LGAFYASAGRSLQKEADSPEGGELCEDRDEQYGRLNEPDEQSYGEDDQPFASFGDPSRAMKSHSFTFRADVADEEGAH
jgi:hypothetical protein